MALCYSMFVTLWPLITLVVHLPITVKQRNPCYIPINLNCITTYQANSSAVGGPDEQTSRAVVW